MSTECSGSTDYSSIGEIQDVEVVGPLAISEYAFVDLIANHVLADAHRGAAPSRWCRRSLIVCGSTWRLGILARYLLDWVGVRYLVLDKLHFNVAAELMTDRCGTCHCR